MLSAATFLFEGGGAGRAWFNAVKKAVAISWPEAGPPTQERGTSPCARGKNLEHVTLQGSLMQPYEYVLESQPDTARYDDAMRHLFYDCLA
jgi:hypothetical protein